MTVSTKALNTVAFFDAGFACGNNDILVTSIVEALADDAVEQARDAFVEGYVLANAVRKANAKAVTHKLRALAKEICEAVGPEAKTVPDGKRKRADFEHAWFIAGRRRFNRARAKLNVPSVDNRGGARERDDAEPQVMKVEAVKDAADANKHLLNMAMMMSSFCKKNEAHVSPAASSLVADFVADIAKLSK